MKFNEIGLSDYLERILIKEGYEKPTPIQEQAIPIILNSKDLIGIAQTGSGKTAAYALPIIEKLKKSNNNKKEIKALILCPTRELAMQIRNTFNIFSSDFLRSDAFVGGVNINYQLRSLKKGLDVLVATPGRLKDLLNQRKINLATIECIVLDEADTMLDMGFINDIKFILSKTRKNRQTMMFSATMAPEILKLTKEFMINPETIEIKLTNEEKPQIDEKLYFVDKNSKKDFILKYLSHNQIKQAIIFTRTKFGADKLGKFLNSYNLKCEIIHGDKSQGARTKSLKDFKMGKSSYLIATDIAARGLDINNLPYVINYDLPEQSEIYIHRIGRTGRAGKKGNAVSLVSKDEIGKLKGIQSLIKHDIPIIIDDEYSIDIKIFDNFAKKRLPKSYQNQKKKQNTNKYHEKFKKYSKSVAKKNF